VLSGLLMLVLFLGELNLYLTTKTHDELFVDTGADDKLRINIDITMHAMQCSCMPAGNAHPYPYQACSRSMLWL
jgi:hypothetical protein